jgi:uncharacterized membrane protein
MSTQPPASAPSSPPASARPESRRPAAAAIVAVMAVQLALPDTLTFGPRGLLPAVEAVLLLVILATNPSRLTSESADMRMASLGLIAIIATANLLSLVLLVDALLNGGDTSGRLLILAALGVWLTNVVVFALTFWELDRGGPQVRSIGKLVDPDLWFPQNSLSQSRYATWTPVFADYLYVSFTNSTAFSPTDTMPLTSRIKMAMLVQSLLSLVTIALVGARAVNILG